MLSNDDINVIKLKNENFQNDKNILRTDVYFNNFIYNFNRKRIESSYTDDDKIVMIETVDINEIDLYKKALEKFNINLKENNYYIKDIKKNNIFDSCPDPILGYNITIVSNNYKEKSKSILEKIMSLF